MHGLLYRSKQMKKFFDDSRSRRGAFHRERGAGMDLPNDERLIKLATETIDLVILRGLVMQAETRRFLPSIQEQIDRLTRARDLLAECNTTVVLQ
jgi:hypothetical protein